MSKNLQVNHVLDYISNVGIYKTRISSIILCYHLGIATKALENWLVGEEWTGEVRPDRVPAVLHQEDLIHTEAARKLPFTPFKFLSLLSSTIFNFLISTTAFRKKVFS